MACNGNNHRKDCQCNFRGGHPNYRRPVWRGWRRSAVRRYISGPNAICPECRAAVYYVPGPRGGGAYFDCFGPPWLKHPCTNQPKPYSPYNRLGRPKLRNRRSQFERSGWVPFFIRNIESLAVGTIIHGVAFDSPTILHFGTLKMEIWPDKERPIYFRPIKGEFSDIELNFFPMEATEPVTELLFDDCRNELELLLKPKPDDD